MNKKLKEIIKTTQILKEDEQKLLKINEKCLNDPNLSAYELLRLLSVSGFITENATSYIENYKNQIQNNMRSLDKNEYLMHIGIANLIFLPFIILAPNDKVDINTKIMLSSVDLGITSLSWTICFHNILSHMKIIRKLSEDNIEQLMLSIPVSSNMCFDTIMEKINQMLEFKNVNSDEDFIYQIANSNIMKLFQNGDVEKCITLPDNVLAEMINILQHDLETTETDLETLMEMAKERIMNNPYDKTNILQRKK